MAPRGSSGGLQNTTISFVSFKISVLAPRGSSGGLQNTTIIILLFCFVFVSGGFFKARIQAPGPEHRLKTCVSPSSIDSWSNRVDWIANSRGKVNLKVAPRKPWEVWGAGGFPGKRYNEITGYSPMKHCKENPSQGTKHLSKLAPESQFVTSLFLDGHFGSRTNPTI